MNIDPEFFIALTSNAALLMTLGLLYDVFSLQNKTANRFVIEFSFGMVIGLIAIVLMSMPAVLGPGLIFDTRTILMCLTGLYFGPITTIVAAMIAGSYRYQLGGIGVVAGIATIVSAGAVGLLWSQLRLRAARIITLKEHYLFGLSVHFAMLMCMFLLPSAFIKKTILSLLFPFVAIYPVGTALLGSLISNRRKRFLNACELDRSEQLHRTILETAMEGILRVDDSGRIIEGNDAYSVMSGYDRDELKSLNLSDLDSELTPLEIEGIIKKVKTEGIDFLETTHKRKNGSLFKIEVSTNYLPIGGGQFISFVRDVTARKKIEHELKESQKQYQDLVERTEDLIIKLDREGRLVFVNESAGKYYRLSKEDCLGRAVFEFIHSEDLEKSREEFSRCVQENADAGFHCENRLMSINGREHHIHWLSQTHYDEQGLFSGFSCTGRDISQLKEAEEKIREHTEILNKISVSAKDAIVQTDAKGDISFWNKSAQRIFGYSADEAMGKYVHSLLAPQSSLNSIQNAFNHFRETGEGQALGRTLELEAVHKDGHSIPVELSLSTFVHDNEVHGLAIVRDISKRKNAEKQQRELEMQLRQKYKIEAIGVMAGGIAHNFNNNLAIMLGNLELAKKNQKGQEDWNQYIDNIFVAIKRSKDLVQQILAYSRNEVKETTQVDPAFIIQESLQLLRAVIPTSVDLSFESHVDGLGVIEVAPGKLQECLINLCTNAVYAIEEKGEIRFSLDTVTLEQHDISKEFDCKEGQYALIKVADSGCGMTKETQQKIFDPFFTTKDVGVGTGMGLATVLGYVKNCGGMVRVISEWGRGSTFELYFPLSGGTADSVPQTMRMTNDLRSREHILLVDDEEMLTALTEEILSDYGYKVTVATDSRSALEKVKAEPELFDLLITDQTMPNMTGLELISAIKVIRHDLPAVLISGYNSSHYQDTAKLHGVNAFCQKPIEIKDLLTTLRQVLAAR